MARRGNFAWMKNASLKHDVTRVGVTVDLIPDIERCPWKNDKLCY